MAETRQEQLKSVAEAYFRALSEKDFDAIPFDDRVILRAPLAPGGAERPLEGKEALRTVWWPPLVPALRTARVIEHFINDDQTAICTKAEVEVGDPPVTLRVVDLFRVNEDGRIIEQENHFDPRPVTHPEAL